MERIEITAKMAVLWGIKRQKVEFTYEHAKSVRAFTYTTHIDL